MTEHEQLMYHVLGRISESNAPIVFKGALITKLILAENGYTASERMTRDIDANWVDIPPSMCVLVETVNKSLESFDGALHAETIREYGEGKSAGIAITNTATGDRIISMDITIKPVFGSREYFYGEVGIRGVLACEILADKISVLSKQIMFRRVKDLVDVYALAHCVNVQTTEIFDVFKGKLAVVGEFSELFTQRDDVEHAYNKLKRMENKPLFDDVYTYLTQFVQPFAQQDETPRIWNSESLTWEDL